MSGSTLESELKFRSDDDAALRRLATARTLGPALLGPASTIHEVDRYLDTSDLRLRASGWACRLRTRGGQARVSLKGPARHVRGALLHERPEVEGPVAVGDDPSTWPPSPARDRLLAMAADQPLGERCVLDQLRTERAVTIGTQRVGLLSLDRVSVRHEGAVLGDLHLVELELDATAMAAGLDPGPLAATLTIEPGLRPDEKSKLEHALELIAAAGR